MNKKNSLFLKSKDEIQTLFFEVQNILHLNGFDFKFDIMKDLENGNYRRKSIFSLKNKNLDRGGNFFCGIVDILSYPDKCCFYYAESSGHYPYSKNNKFENFFSPVLLNLLDFNKINNSLIDFINTFYFDKDKNVIVHSVNDMYILEDISYRFFDFLKNTFNWDLYDLIDLFFLYFCYFELNEELMILDTNYSFTEKTWGEFFSEMDDEWNLFLNQKEVN